MESRLSSAGLRSTVARRAVLAVLDRAERALSHADIEATLAEPLDRVTLYRTLDRFVEAKIVSRSVGPDRVSRFALLAPLGASAPQQHEAHAHFHCDDCGRVYCLPSRPPRHPPLPDGFALEGASLNFHGHCAACAAH
jgi:Fur family transcriptional regulator, ferric uptake regulator